MKKIIIIIFVFFHIISYSQVISNSEMSLKEFYDSKVYSSLNLSAPNNICPVSVYPASLEHLTPFNNTTGADDLAEVIAPVMDAQLVLYETTKDKGYLINFINDAIQMVSMRADYLNIKTT